ncbi:MAG: rhodanese-like domain-containing protein [Thermoanaerobaculia bacterium]|nr:MAG: rhodanese-like domain-containing protein [Thermoanaerobaculia bacterium]
MATRTRALGLSAALLLGGVAAAEDRGALANPKIDAPGFLRLAEEAIRQREDRRVGEEEFLRLAAVPGTVVLDARSRDKFEALHVRGAVSLPFTDFTAESLARAIPSRATRVLIYCNNNFEGAEEPFPTKAAPAALNLSTYVALHTYGYRNVWELGPLVEVASTLLPLEGASARRRGDR